MNGETPTPVFVFGTAWWDRVFARVYAAAFGNRQRSAARAMWLGRFCRTVSPGSGTRLRLRWCPWKGSFHGTAFTFAPAGQVERALYPKPDTEAP